MPIVREAYLTKNQMEEIGIEEKNDDFGHDEDWKAAEAEVRRIPKEMVPLCEEGDMGSVAAYYFPAEKAIVPVRRNENGLRAKIYAEWECFDKGELALEDMQYPPASEQQVKGLCAYLGQFIRADGTVKEAAPVFLASGNYLVFREGSAWLQHKLTSQYSKNSWKFPVWNYSPVGVENLLDCLGRLYQIAGLLPMRMNQVDTDKILKWLTHLKALSKARKLTQEQYTKLMQEVYRKADFLRLGDEHYRMLKSSLDHGQCWEVYEKGQPNVKKACCSFPDGEWLSAVPPAESIVQGGLVSVDFGTKNTVVVISDFALRSHQVRKQNGGVDPWYPTVLKFSDLGHFLKAYKASCGRPETLWDDVSIGDARALRKSADSAYGIFRSLKQWMLDPVSRNVVLRQEKARDKPILLNEYGSDQNTVDPIELYAYYLGLYINNNQDGKIYMRYRLSFSVVCSETVQNRLQESFQRGIMKSLPASIVKDEERMKDFSVECTCSEPVAYAVCALACMDIPALCQGNFFYGIFDFGGGTCDFNYGVWKLDRNEKLDEDIYKIGILGDGGDPYLGGENLLELLAVKLYEEQKEAFLECGYKIARPRSYEGGNQGFFSTSLEAADNLMYLVDQIRYDIWEKPDSNEDEPEEFEIVISGLRPEQEEGSRASSKRRTCSVVRLPLQRLLVERIYQGITDFFGTCYGILDELRMKEIPQMCVFLAGNSCRSPWVRKLFEKYIRDELDQTYIQKVYVCVPMGSRELIESIPSDLWKENQKEKMRNRIGRFGDLDGKTGVAYGLALYGTEVKVESLGRQDLLRYYIGKKQLLDIKALKGKQGRRLTIGESIPFASSVSDLYYTLMIPKDGEFRELGAKVIPLSGRKLSAEDNQIWYVRADSQTQISIFAAMEDHPEMHDPKGELMFDLQFGQFRQRREGT